jgi:hypothetical protein
MQTEPNPLFRLLIWNWLAGAAAAIVLVGGLIASDTLHLRSLILDSATPAVPLVMLTVGFLITLCSVAMGSAIMAMPSDDDAPQGGRREPLIGIEPAPVRVAVERRVNRRR